jgi:hypothetical protein
MSTQNPETADKGKIALNKRLETFAWGLFLVMLGGFMYVPETAVSKGVWSMGVGLIMLGLNFLRYQYKIRMSGFTTVIGLVALAAGILQVLGIMAMEGAVLLIILGVYLIFKPWFEDKKLFGKAEQN